MTVVSQPRNRYLDRPAPSSLADVIETILDKGLVIDIYVRVSLVGIELLTIDARIVIASVDTYLRFAEAVNRLDLTETEKKGLSSARSRSDRSSEGEGSLACRPPLTCPHSRRYVLWARIGCCSSPHSCRHWRS